MHDVFLLITLFSNILQNEQLQKPIANYIIRRLLSLLKNWGDFIAVTYARRGTDKSDLLLHDIWTERWKVPLCTSAMSRNRFCKILRFLHFDVKSNRLQRLQTDKFALFSGVWNHIINNCCTCYKSVAFITINGQLFPSKA